MELRIRWWLVLLVVAGLALCLAACSSTEEPASSSESAAETTTAVLDTEAPEVETPQADVSEPDVATSTTTEAVEADVVEDITPDPLDAFSHAQEALDALESYRYTTSFVFVGEEDGVTETGSIELSGVVAGPGEVHLVWHDLGVDESFEVIQIGNQAWILESGEWSEVPILVSEAMSSVALVYAPSVTWGGLFGELEPDASYVGRESVGDVEADHYAATYTQWGTYWPGELYDAAGDVWIADEGYPVKYYFSATGVDEDGERGSVTWTMELTDVNEPLTIEAPI